MKAIKSIKKINKWINVGLTPSIKTLDTPPHNLTMTLTRRLDRWKMFQKQFQFLMTSYLIIHNASLIFTTMQIKPRLLMHIQTIM